MNLESRSERKARKDLSSTIEIGRPQLIMRLLTREDVSRRWRGLLRLYDSEGRLVTKDSIDGWAALADGVACRQ